MRISGITRTLGRAMEARSKWAREVGLRGMLDEFSTNLVEELDYYAEAYNMSKLAANMAELPGVHVPDLHRDLSSMRVLTQEYISGVKISNVAAMDAAGLDRSVIGENALRAAIKMMLIDGFFHADPHPGNLIVNLDTGVVTFLDSGMVGELSVAQRVNMIALLWTVVKGDMTAMGQQLRSLSQPFRPVDDAAFVRAFERKMARYGKGSGADFRGCAQRGDGRSARQRAAPGPRADIGHEGHDPGLGLLRPAGSRRIVHSPRRRSRWCWSRPRRPPPR